MKRQHIIALIIVSTVLLMAGAAGFYFLRNPSAWQSILTELDLAEPTTDGLTASGFIEAEEVHIGPQLGGRVHTLFVEEGDDVDAGHPLVRIDGTLLEAQIASARAGVDIAEAELAQVQAGARVEQIRQAEAGLAQARAARNGARKAWQDAQAIRDNPQELDAQIARARAAVASADAALAEAIAQKDAAVIANENYWDAKEEIADAKKKLEKIPEPQRPDLPGFQLDFHMIPYQYWKAWVGVNTAEAQLQGARSSLNNLLEMRQNPQDLEAQVDAARAGYQRAKAAVQQAEAQLAVLRSGATPEEIAAAQAQAEQAQAALDRLLSEQEKLSIAAPVGGLVLELSIHEGELAAPGATILTLGDLDEVTLTVYVPEDQLGKVNVGQVVEVEVDSFPGETFRGTVVAIATEAEFTPRNVQTEEERVNMVFAVDVSIPNPDHKLKPGVPADATILTEEQ